MDMCSRVHDVHNLSSDLENTSHESLHVDDAPKSELATEGNGACDVGEENLSGGVKQQETKLNTICLTKSATFPIPRMMLPSGSSDEEADTSVAKSHSEQSAGQTYSRSVSLPAPELIPALKGSREKYRGSPMKLTVKWAPDVYDPVPTLMSHTVKNKKQQKSRKKKNEKKYEKKTEKKNGKKGQKGNSSSRGGSGKDKKQARNQGGHSDMSFESLDSHDNVIGASSELDALDVRSHDSFCGTSFLKNSVTKVHSLVAEAQ